MLSRRCLRSCFRSNRGTVHTSLLGKNPFLHQQTIYFLPSHKYSLVYQQKRFQSTNTKEDFNSLLTKVQKSQKKGNFRLAISLISIWITGYLLYSLTTMGSSLKFDGHSTFNKADETQAVGFDDVVGQEAIVQEFKVLVDIIKHPSAYSEMGAKLPKGVLLYGPPGTGKTLLARALAHEAGIPFLYQHGGQFDELFVGVGSQRVERLFRRARKLAPCIIFIDEIDALTPNRKGLVATEKFALHQLLAELDGFVASDGILFIGSTNNRDQMDPAILRPGRIDKQFKVNLPTQEARQRIYKHYISKKKNDIPDSEILHLAKSSAGFSGADIENIVNIAALTAVQCDSKIITQQHIQDAFQQIKLGLKRTLRLTEEDKRVAAYRESAKIIVSHYNPKAPSIHTATIIPRGDKLGHTSTVPPSEVSMSKANIKAMIDANIAGTVCDGIIYGNDFVTLREGDDGLEVAHQLAYRAIVQSGMGDVGFVGQSNWKEMSDPLRDRYTKDIDKFLDESKTRVNKILREHMDELNLLVDNLLEKECLTREEIISILDKSKSA